MTSPLLWYLNRGTGVVLLVVFTLTVVLGVLATGRTATPLWPRFVTQGLHRTLAALSVLLLTAHALSAVVDEYVDIRWWQALVPVGGTYQPLWLGLGTLALDLTLVVVATSLARSRMPHRAWFLVHLTTYAAWVAGVVHGIGIGTDASRGWMVLTTAGCVAAVVVASLARVVAVVRGRRAAASNDGTGPDSDSSVRDLFPADLGGAR
ncbi:MAG: ferric reductase-like transmembrane domain-containing protein [Ornithinibacter sp.]